MKKILIINNNKNDLITFQTAIEKDMTGCISLTALTGKEGIKIAREEQPATILLDMAMPDMDGHEVCRRIRENDSTRDIPVIMIMATKTDTKNRVEGIDVGVDAFLFQPFHPAEFLAQINLMLRIKGAEDKLRTAKERLEEAVQKRTNKLLASNYKLQTLLNTTTEIAGLAKSNGIFLAVNDALAKSFGKEKDQLIGISMFEILPNNIVKKRKAILQKIVEYKKPLQWEDERAGKCFDNNVYPIIEEDGSVKQVAFFAKDITKQKKAEERFRFILENSIMVIYNLNLSTGTYDYLSPAVKEIYGYPPEYFIGGGLEKSLNDFHPDDIEKMSAHLEKLLSGKLENFSSTVEYRFKHPKLGYRWMSDTRTAIFDDNGNPISLIGNAYDITDRKKSEETIKRNLEFQKLISSISSGFVGTFNLDDSIIKLLKSIGEFSGASRSYIFRLHNNGKTMDNTHEWCTEGVAPQIDNLQNLSGDTFPWIMSRLHKSEIIHIKDVSTLPLEAQTEKEIFEIQNIKSLIIFPLNIFGELIGFIGFDNVREAKAWSIETIKVLKISSEILANTIHSKNAENELIVSEEKYKSIFENKGTATGIFDKDMTIITCNSKFEELSGYSKQEVAGIMKWPDLIAKEDLERLHKYHLQRTDKTKNTPTQYECGIIKKNGEQIYCSLNIGLSGTDRIASLIDITKRKEAEQALQKSEKKFRSLITNIPDVVWTTDIKGNTSFISENVKSVYGYSKKEVYESGVRLFIENIHPEDQGLVKKAFGNLFLNGHKFDIKYRIKKKNGEWIWLHDRAINIFEKDGIQYADGIFSDITEIINAEKALRENEDKFRSIFEAATDGILYVDKKARILDVNPAFTKITSIPKNEVVGKTGIYLAKKFVTIKQLPAIIKMVKAWVTTKKTKSIELEFNNKILDIFTYEISHSEKHMGVIRDITNQKQSEAELRKSREQYKSDFELFRLMADNSADMLWAKDIEGRFTFTNKAICKNLINAKDVNEAIGKDVMFFVNRERETHPENKQWFTFGEDCGDSDAITIANKKTCRFDEYGNVFGKYLYLDVYKTPLRNNKEKMIGTVGSARIVTKEREIEHERRKAEKALRESEEKFRSVLRSMDDIVFVLDKENRFISVNVDENESELLLKPEVFLGKKHSEIVPKHIDDLFNKAMINVNKGETEEYEYSLEMRDEIRWYALKISPVLNDGKFDGSVSVVRDITEKKQTEQVLRESQSRFKALSEATYEAIFISEKGVCIETNEAAGNMFGYSYDEIIGIFGTDVIAPESEELVKNNMISGYEKPYDAIALRKDGTKFHAEFQGRTFMYKGKKARITAVRDISIRKKNELLLQESKMQLEEVNTKLHEIVLEEVKRSRKKDRLMVVQSKQAAMGEMIGNIAHQWRQPLNDVGLYVQNLQDSYEFGELTDERLKSTVEKTMNKLQYMSQTIDDFRNFFRSDKEKSKFSLSNSLNKTLLLMEASFRNSTIEIILNIREEPHITAYPNEFSQAVLNILNNAKDVLIERKIQNPCVKINLLKQDDKAIVTIADNAGGINKDIIDKIFEPYFTTRDKSTGTGLGLYISKTIIERNMSGKLSVKNTKQGAEFRIEL